MALIASEILFNWFSCTHLHAPDPRRKGGIKRLRFHRHRHSDIALPYPEVPATQPLPRPEAACNGKRLSRELFLRGHSGVQPLSSVCPYSFVDIP